MAAPELQVYRGDNKTLRVSITDAQCRPVDTTGWQVDFSLKESETAAAVLVSKSSANPGEVDAVDEAGGIWDVSLLPADTDQEIKTYVFDVQVTTDDVPAKIYTVIKGTLEILQDVTP